MASLKPLQPLTLDPNAIKRWMVKDYHRMSELGLLDPNERTELLAGQITLRVAKGTPHVTALSLLTNALRDQLGNQGLIRTQDPFNWMISQSQSRILHGLKATFWITPNSIPVPIRSIWSWR
ncbi:MAG: hypothetical protein WCD18_14545 [Thermosynechococcaceae cyanobacterium]